MDWTEQLEKDLKRDEGLELKAYKDTVGVWTIGYGYTGPEVRPGLVWTFVEAELKLLERMKVAIKDARTFFSGFSELDPVRKTVLANMAYNLGLTRLQGFKNFKAALVAKDYTQAALAMKDSKWAAQTKQRATRLAKRMSTGKIEQ